VALPLRGSGSSARRDQIDSIEILMQQRTEQESTQSSRVHSKIFLMRFALAVIVQTDAFSDDHASMVVCQMTSEILDTPDFRMTLDPAALNGLRVVSQIKTDKPVTIRRGRIAARSAGSIRKKSFG
jgi:hypothetical protein